MKSLADNFDPDALLAMRGTWTPVETPTEDLDFSSIIASQKADLREANLTIAQLTAENERLKKREADNILLAWGGVCPSGWAMTGDPSHMAEIIRQRGDELQTENLRVKVENERLTRVVEQFTWKPISEYVKPTEGRDCHSFIGQTSDGRVFECYWSHIDQEFGAYGGPAEPVYFMEYPKAQLKGVV
jgi:hypothetical protein